MVGREAGVLFSSNGLSHVWGNVKSFPTSTPHKMITEEQIQRITDIAQEKGWSVNVEDKNETRVLFEFQRYTKYGQDFLFNADMQGEDIDSLIANVKEYYEGFDPDYEAYLWIGDDGHGKNGAPYHIKDIVADMEDAEEQIYELLQAFEMEFL